MRLSCHFAGDSGAAYFVACFTLCFNILAPPVTGMVLILSISLFSVPVELQCRKAILNLFSCCAVFTFFGGPTDRHFTFYVLSKLLGNLFSLRGGIWTKYPLFLALLGHQQLCAKISVVVKGFLRTRLCVSHYSGTTWKDDPESSFLEMNPRQRQKLLLWCPVFRNESF